MLGKPHAPERPALPSLREAKSRCTLAVKRATIPRQPGGEPALTCLSEDASTRARGTQTVIPSCQFEGSGMGGGEEPETSSSAVFGGEDESPLGFRVVARGARG